MADAPIIPAIAEAQTVVSSPTSAAVFSVQIDKPILPHSGTLAAGGATSGQLWPLGNN